MGTVGNKKGESGSKLKKGKRDDNPSVLLDKPLGIMSKFWSSQRHNTGQGKNINKGWSNGSVTTASLGRSAGPVRLQGKGVGRLLRARGVEHPARWESP